MVKKIKKRNKLEKPKFNWKVIVALIGATILVILLLMAMGKAGLNLSGR